MTPEQFDLVAKLLRSQERIAKAVRLVLLDGVAPSEAAKQEDLSPQSVSNALARYRVTHAELSAAYGRKNKVK